VKKIFLIFITLAIIILSTGIYFYIDENASSKKVFKSIFLKPIIFVDDFKVEIFAELSMPTTMSFMGNDLLVLERDGNVKLIRDGHVQTEPILTLDVISSREWGLLGITTFESDVYLYFTQEKPENEIHNYIYKYQWDGFTLVNPQLLTILPGEEGVHNGGAMTVDEKGNVYAVIGDQTAVYSPITNFGILQNNQNGTVNDTGIIRR